MLSDPADNMSVGALLSLCFGVAVSVEEAREVPQEASDRLIAMLAAELERRTGARPVIDHRIWSTCEDGARCLADVRARTGEKEILLLRIFGGPLSIQLAAERVGDGDPLIQTIDLPRTKEAEWQPMIAALVGGMFPAGPARPEISLEPVVTEEPRSFVPDWVDWVLLGGAIAAAGVSTGFAISSAGAKSDAEVDFLPGDRTDQLTARYEQHRGVAIGTGVTGAVLLGASVVLFVFD